MFVLIFIYTEDIIRNYSGLSTAILHKNGGDSGDSVYYGVDYLLYYRLELFPQLILPVKTEHQNTY